jgi:hypothetical protein
MLAITEFYGPICWKLTKEVMTVMKTADRLVSGVAVGYGMEQRTDIVCTDCVY